MRFDGAPNEPERRDLLTVRAQVVDPVLARLGYSPTDTYTEMFWLPRIGPTTYCILRRLAVLLELTEEDGSVTVQTAALGRWVGVRHNEGRHSALWRSVRRLTAFGLGQWDPDGTLAVATVIRPLTRTEVGYLPPDLQHTHRELVERAAEVDLSAARHPSAGHHLRVLR